MKNSKMFEWNFHRVFMAIGQSAERNTVEKNSIKYDTLSTVIVSGESMSSNGKTRIMLQLFETWHGNFLDSKFAFNNVCLFVFFLYIYFTFFFSSNGKLPHVVQRKNDD